MIATRTIVTATPSKQHHQTQAVATPGARAVRSGAAAAAALAAATCGRRRGVLRAMASSSSVFRFQQPSGGGEQEDARQYAAAASRNEAPILEALTARLEAAAAPGGGGAAVEKGDGGGAAGALLEVACGTGQHSAAFSRALVGPGRPLSAYLPTDLNDGLFSSVFAHGAASGVPGLLPPRVLDVSLSPEHWFTGGGGNDGPSSETPPPLPHPLRAVLAVNLTHISPWPATLGLLRGAAEHLDPSSGQLFLYGPFTRRGGRHVGDGDGNARFDASLRAQDPAWGYRDVDAELAPAAEAAGLALDEAAEMPSNNLLLVFSRRQKGSV